MKMSQRKSYLVDPKVQLPLLMRVVCYWMLCIVAMGLMAGVQVSLSSHAVSADVLITRVMLAFGPALVASLLVLPVLLFDCVRFSNRFAGPMHRLRATVKQLADTGDADPLIFRKGDFWYDLAEQFNRIAEQKRESLVPSGGMEGKAADRTVEANTLLTSV